MAKKWENSGIPDHWWDSEVRVKENPDNRYSAEFLEAQKKKLEQLKAEQAARKHS